MPASAALIARDQRILAGYRPAPPSATSLSPRSRSPDSPPRPLAIMVIVPGPLRQPARPELAAQTSPIPPGWLPSTPRRAPSEIARELGCPRDARL